MAKTNPSSDQQETGNRNVHASGSGLGILPLKARLAAAIEIAAPRLFLPALLWLGFLAAALFDMFGALFGFFHALILIGLIAYTIRALLGIARDIPAAWLSKRDVLRRIETDSAMAHRPLTSAGDAPIQRQDPAAVALWYAERAREKKRVEALIRLPDWGWLEKDPLAMRAAVIFLVAVAFVTAGASAPRRLADAFQPSLFGEPVAPRVEAWIIPPDYTGLADIVLADPARANAKSTDEIRVPAGSRLRAAISGARKTPKLYFDKDRRKFEAVGTRRFTFDQTINSPVETLTLTHAGRTLGEWPIQYVVDQPPLVLFTDEPSETAQSALRFDYELVDDYGVEALELVVWPTTAKFEDGNRFEIAVPPSGRSVLQRGAPTETVTQTSFKDLTKSRWAGLPVKLQLVARDAVGQLGTSEIPEITLPERAFSHPVAIEIIALRKRLFAADPRKALISELDRLSGRPDRFDDDFAVFAALRSSRWRLYNNKIDEATDEIAEILWQTALRLEDGQISLAQNALKDSVSELMDALRRGETDALDQLGDDIRNRLQALLEAQRQAQANAMQGMENRELPPMQPGQMRTVSQSMLERMIEQIQDLAAAGETEAAMELLADLQNILENLATNVPSREDLERAMATNEAMQSLDNVRRMEEQLMNDTARQRLADALGRSRDRGQRDQDGQPVPAPSQSQRDGQSQGEGQSQGDGWARGQQGSGEPRAGQGERPGSGRGDGAFGSRGIRQLGPRQDEINELTDGIAGQLGEAGLPIPEALGKARQHMGDAQSALNEGDGLGALKSQAEALRAIERAQQNLNQSAQQAMQQLQQMQGRVDPLGRSANGNGRGETVKIPTESDFDEAREILRELQRRLSDRSRSQRELDYIQRLLDKF
ncbi:MAG: DUF4175 family protein [Pseudomonadota bacterium]